MFKCVFFIVSTVGSMERATSSGPVYLLIEAEVSTSVNILSLVQVG